MPTTSRWLVETQWLADHLNAPDVLVLDGSMHLPTAKRDARAEYEAEHIPGALFFDIDAISDKSNPLPHMLPSPVQFASQMKKMGIGDGLRVVIYDSEGLYSAARVWWMFRTMGHLDVAVLNGGLKKWKAQGRPLDRGSPPPRTPRHFTPRFNAGLVREAEEVKALIGDKAVQIVDARAAARFAGTAPEPRAGLRSGHIPSSRSLPFTNLLNPDGTLKDKDGLRAAFKAAVWRPTARWWRAAALASPPASSRWRWPRSARPTRLLVGMGRPPGPAGRDGRQISAPLRSNRVV